MNFELKRIEDTLERLNAQGMPISAPSTLAPTQMPPVQSRAQSQPGVQRAKSSVQPFPLPKLPEVYNSPESRPESSPESSLDLPVGESPARVQPPRNRKAAAKAKKTSAQTAKAARPSAHPPVSQPVHPFPVQQNGTEAPTFPRPKPASFSSHRHAVNPDLAIGLLKEVETVIVRWQLELEQTVLEIQALYLEGPIVDGWLESHPHGSPQVMQPIGAATLRHAEIDRLMDYVEEICRIPTMNGSEAPRTGYRLCGLDADGQLWSRPCPPQQVPYVSLAIARYQKLRILFARKQNLETRLNHLIQSLTLLHGQMQD